MNLIAADIGGTTSRLACLSASSNGVHRPISEQHYPSHAFPDLASLIHRFMADAHIGLTTIEGITLALPGPVQNGGITLTNLGWHIDLEELQRQVAPAHVDIINDFQAAANGVVSLNASDLTVLNPGNPVQHGLRLVTGAGTGLGLAWIPAGAGASGICASEGGHIDFAPVDAEQHELLAFLAARHGHVSYERILSGDGLVQLYHFLSLETGVVNDVPPVVPGTAAEVSRLAGAQHSTATRAVRLFIRIYAQWVGNLALLYRPEGGLFIAGGMAAKMAAWMQSDDFMPHCRDKGRMRRLVQQTPIYLVTNERLGLQGAINMAIAKAHPHARMHA